VAITDPEVRGSGRVQNAFFPPPALSFPSKELRFIHPAFSKVAIVTTTTKTVITINYNIQKRETNSRILI
jgi:hypothetical protein